MLPESCELHAELREADGIGKDDTRKAAVEGSKEQLNVKQSKRVKRSGSSKSAAFGDDGPQACARAERRSGSGESAVCGDDGPCGGGACARPTKKLKKGRFACPLAGAYQHCWSTLFEIFNPIYCLP